MKQSQQSPSNNIHLCTNDPSICNARNWNCEARTCAQFFSSGKLPARLSCGPSDIRWSDQASSMEPCCLIHGSNREVSSNSTSTSLTTNQMRNYDVYIGLRGTEPSLLKFTNWLHAELEAQGFICLAVDRAQSVASEKLKKSKMAMNVSTLGVMLITKKSFNNPYSIEELRHFSGKNNLVPIFFDLKPEDCTVREIVERRGRLWEKHGGKLWALYEGSQRGWKEAVNGLLQAGEWNLEAWGGAWRDCIFSAVLKISARLGRSCAVNRLIKWKERVEKEEFPFHRNEHFVGRKKELSELELILFGHLSGDSERDIEIKEKNSAVGGNKKGSEDKQLKETLDRGMSKRKGKKSSAWKESENEYGYTFSQVEHHPTRPKSWHRCGSRQRSSKFVHGKGIACVSGTFGIGKTELLLEFAYRFHQRYKMVLWIGGEGQYIKQNYLNLGSFLDVDVGIEGCLENSQNTCFEEREKVAISRLRRELMRNIPYLLVIDNLESEKDWWDHNSLTDLLPCSGSETHVLISTCRSRVMNIEPLQLSALSKLEGMLIMIGNADRKDYPDTEIGVLQVIEEKLGGLTLGLAIIGAILSEFPITPSRLLDIINKVPLRSDFTYNRGREGKSLNQNGFLLQILEVILLIFNHADGSRSLASMMVEVSGWFAPAAIPISLLALAADKLLLISCKATVLWKKLCYTITHAVTSSFANVSKTEAASTLVRFKVARSSSRLGELHFNHLTRLYARERGAREAAKVMLEVVTRHCSISQHSEHLWAACFLMFGFRHKPKVINSKLVELLSFVKTVALPLATQSFMLFSRCGAAVELLRHCSEALEAADQTLVMPVDRWLPRSLCCGEMQSMAQLDPFLWQQLALSKCNVFEVRANLMLLGGHVDVADDMIQKALFIRTSICGKDHPTTVSTHGILKKLSNLQVDVERHAESH